MNVDEDKSAPSTPSAPSEQLSTSPPKAVRRKRWRLVALSIAVILALAGGVPWVLHSLSTESTDDAYVNSYVTFVAPRVTGQVARVLVSDNNRVKKGDVLVELDPEPYQVQVAIKQAAVDTAQANLVLT